ncbi:MAG: sugar phosphate isomerase/epimerase [Lentisphaerae bacterium]|nr:sugar phosphate isomerase/epimerase [Lentisphaerota bacterium]
MTTRRGFFKQAGFGLAAAAGAPAMLAGEARAAAGDAKDTFRLGLAGYTFNKFQIDPTLEMVKKVDVHFLCIKDFHLPFTSTPEEIAAFHAKCKDAGVTGYGVGPIYMDGEKAVDDAFEYARRVGVKLIVGVPHGTVEKKKVESPELIRYVEDKVKAYDMQFAIHNHGPDNLPYATAGSIMEFIRDLDPRVGICLDIGHNLRAGACPIAEMEAFAGRVHDIHIKNVTAASKEGKGVEMPRGLIDIPAFVRVLRKVKYPGVCSLEYEKDMADPILGVAESIGYFRGVMDATR